jgi:Zn-dependent peptidase ImmA (M78 family)
MSTKTIADGLARNHGTRDPFTIANELGFIVVFAPLVDMRGFQQSAKRRRLIYINDELDEQQQRLVCAHELAHHLLHRGMNRIFMDQNTYMVTQRFETEANRFAVDLIYSDEELQPYLSRSYDCAAAYMGVSKALAEYRMGEVMPEHPADEWA